MLTVTLNKQILIFVIINICFSFSSFAMRCNEAARSAAKVPDHAVYQAMQFKVISDRVESLAVRLMAIKQAKRSVDLTTYIFKKDEAGLMVLNELKEAMNRGVKVRILADSIGTFAESHYLRDHLESLITYTKKNNLESLLEIHYAQSILGVHNILKESFAKLLKQGILKKDKNLPLNVNQRIHDKFMLVDAGLISALLLTGGSNIGNKYTGVKSSDKGTFIDLDIIVKPTVSDKTSKSNQNYETLDANYLRYFEMLMYEAPSRKLNGKLLGLLPNILYKKDMNEINNASSSGAVTLIQNKIAQLTEANYLTTGFTNGYGKLVSEFSNLIKSNSMINGSWYKAPKKGGGFSTSIKHSFVGELKNAVSLVEVITPYPIITRKGMARIKELVLSKPNVEVHLYANKRETTDNIVVYIYFKNFVLPKIIKLNKDPRVNGRVKVHLFEGGKANGLNYTFNHTKLARFDKKRVLLTSSNFEARSIRINSESGLHIRGKGVSERFSEHIDLVKSNSIEVKEHKMFIQVVNMPAWKKKFFELTDQILKKFNIISQL